MNTKKSWHKGRKRALVSRRPGFKSHLYHLLIQYFSNWVAWLLGWFTLPQGMVSLHLQKVEKCSPAGWQWCTDLGCYSQATSALWYRTCCKGVTAFHLCPVSMFSILAFDSFHSSKPPLHSNSAPPQWEFCSHNGWEYGDPVMRDGPHITWESQILVLFPCDVVRVVVDCIIGNAALL